MKYEIELDVENADKIYVMTENKYTGISSLNYIPVKPIVNEEKLNLKKRWRANCGESYYYITNDGYIYNSTEGEKVLDDRRYKIGNYYKTTKEAKYALERQKVINELELYSIKDASEINREDGFYVLTCRLDKSVNQIKPTHLYNSMDPFTFVTSKDAEAAIKAIGADRLKKYYFRVVQEE